MAGEKNYDIFISYRRDGGDIMARFLYYGFRKLGYSVFYDFECIYSGSYAETIREGIEHSTDFIVILSPGMFGQYNETPTEAEVAQDEVIQEILWARDYGKNILPVRLKNFDYPKNYPWPKEIIDFPKLNAPLADMSTFRFEFLQNFMKSSPSDIVNSVSEALQYCNRTETKYKGVEPDTLKKTLSEILNTGFLGTNMDMVYDMMQPYLDNDFNEKRNFRYDLYLTQDMRQLKGLPFDATQKYCRLNERLSFMKKFLNTSIQNFWVSFDYGGDSLDKNLHDKIVMFSESMRLAPEDKKILQNMSEDDLKRLFREVMNVQVVVNDTKLQPVKFQTTEAGVMMEYRLPEETAELQFKIAFDIPFEAENNYIYTVITEPTYNPNILVKYDETFSVEMIPFFDQNVTLSKCSQLMGEYEISVENNWVLPMSGAIFMVKPASKSALY